MFAKGQETIYRPDPEKAKITEGRLDLSEEQRNAILQITLGIEEVDENVRVLAVEQGDVLKTMENGHRLNRVFSNSKGQTVGYIACEDFVPHEAYIKYFGTSGQTGRNLLKEVPAFLEYAKQHGYSKINFHGWNPRLNKVLEHFGFKRMRTDTLGRFAADFYERTLVEDKSPQTIEEERRKALEEKYLEWLNQQYQKTLATFSEKTREGETQTARQKKEKIIGDAFQKLSQRLGDQQRATQDLSEEERFEFGVRQQAILKLKLARHFQRKDVEDLNTLYDAIIESPNFIDTDNGLLDKLLEVHQQKTLQKIAEMRKRRAEMKGNEGANPWENLFTTKSDNYYMARLLNMPHLEQESDYMKHCVGTSDSYVNQIKKGEIEILSFRHVPKINSQTQKLEGDTPIITIEYNLKTRTIEQMKKADDEYLNPNDPFYADVLDALKKLRTTTTDTGELRNFVSISDSELQNFEVKDYHLLTENGPIHFRDFNPDSNTLILKKGSLDVTPEMSTADTLKIIRIVAGFGYQRSELARKPDEINEQTKIYIGPFFLDLLESKIEHIYSSFPGDEIWRGNVGTTGKSEVAIVQALEEKGVKKLDYAGDMLRHDDFIRQLYDNTDKPREQWTLKKPEQIRVVRLQVKDLFQDEQTHTTQEIFAKAEQLGLELCPAEVGPALRLQVLDQPMGNGYYIGMKPITDRYRNPRVFVLGRRGDGLWLHGRWAAPDHPWDSHRQFVFRLRKMNSKT